MDTFTTGLYSTVTGSLTATERDRARAVMLIRAARTPEEREQAFRFVMYRRASWRGWVTATQRYWQAQARTEARARHHDSVAIRERYVRCAY